MNKTSANMGAFLSFLTALVALVHPGFDLGPVAQIIISVVALLLGSIIHLNVHRYALLANQISTVKSE